MKNFILFGEMYSNNWGDAIICRTAQKLFCDHVKESSIQNLDISYMRNNKSFLYMFLRKLAALFRFERDFFCRPLFVIYLLTRIRPNSKICFVGGELFLDYFMNSMITILYVARLRHCSVHYLSVGYGIMSKKNKRILKKSLVKINRLTVTMRDGVEIFNNEILDVATWTPDVAMISSLVYGKKEEKDSSRRVGVGCINTKLYNIQHPSNPIDECAYINGMKVLINSLLNTGYDVTLFSNGDYADYIITKKIQEICSGVKIAQCPKSDIEFVEILKGFDFVIASRLHALIVSFSYQIPILGLSWNPKVDYFFSTIEQSKNVYDLKCMHKVDWGAEMIKSGTFRCNNMRLMSVKEKIENRIIEIIEN